MDDALKHAFDKAKIALMSKPDSAFFTTVCFSLKHRWDTTIPTACTDGSEICFNPDYIMGLTHEERVFLLIHETCHVAYDHMGRLAQREAARWNVAADHVINLMLLARGFHMPTGGLANAEYTGLSTEEVYALLPESMPPYEGQDLRPGKGTPEEQAEALQDILVRAAVQSKMANDRPGSIPGEIQIYLDRLLCPKLPWNRILQKYLFGMAKSDYSFRKPNRRFFPQHHLPSLYSESLGHLAVAVDTSGSVSDEEFQVMVSEIGGIFRMCPPERLTLLQFDVEIHTETELRHVNALNQVAFSGRGGTDIACVEAWAQANKPQLLLVFTDGEFGFTDTALKGHVLWLIHNNEAFRAPYGKAIHYTL